MAWPRTLPLVAFGLLLLAGTLAWHVPMMLWDHLDLVPVIDALHAGRLSPATLVDVHHGSHFHATAYVILLATTWLSDGRTWLDCVVGWAMLMAMVALVVAQARASASPARPTRWWWAVPLLALTPGHLVNLQWGWQVAVTACLLASAGCIRLASRPVLRWRDTGLALACAVIATGSFSTGVALWPVGAALALAQPGVAPGRRMAMASLWAAGGIGSVLLLSSAGTALPSPALLLHYLLNFLGAAVSRLATDIAPVVAVLGLATAAWLGWSLRREPQARPWLAWIAFAIGAGLLAAAGRAGTFGAEHAFVTRYVSFSTMFWVGGFALLALALDRRPRGSLRTLRACAACVVILAVANAVHLAKQARDIGHAADATAHEVRTQWPDVDPALLGDIHFGDAVQAKARLERLHARGYAPFDRRPDATPPATAP